MHSKEVVAIVNKVLARLHKRLVLSESLDEASIGPTLDAMLIGYDAMGGGGGAGGSREDQLLGAEMRLGQRGKSPPAQKPVKRAALSLGSRKPVPQSRLAEFVRVLVKSGMSIEKAFAQARRLGVK